MSTPPSQLPSDDLLARAEAALRGAPTPEGPSEPIVSRTLAALEAAGRRADVSPTRRRSMMVSLTKIAALIMAAVGGLFYLGGPPPAGPGNLLAFAETAQKLREAHTLSYRMIMRSDDPARTTSTRLFYKEPGLVRAEADGGIISVADASRGKHLVLDPAARSALLLEGGSPTKLQPEHVEGGGLLERLRKLTEADAEPVGEKVIDGVQARGYLVKKLGAEMTVWVDPESRLPLRIESSSRVQDEEVRVTLTDFRIDPELDDALFRLEPPPGYALRKAESGPFADEATFLDPEKAAVALLRAFAEKTGGTFPKRLDDLSEFDEVFPKKTKIGQLPDPDLIRVVQAMVRFLMVTRSLDGGFGYRSEGVKLGDADKILFWYRPEGATRYRAIHGDLQVRDVEAERLPEVPGR